MPANKKEIKGKAAPAKKPAKKPAKPTKPTKPAAPPPDRVNKSLGAATVPQYLPGKGPLKPGDPGYGKGYYPDYPVGKGNPPRAGQIQPGEVRNPKGYPTGVKNAKTVIKYWLGVSENVTNPLSGEEETLDQLDIMTLGIISKARSGDVSAYNTLLDRLEGKPVQSTKLLGQGDKQLVIKVGYRKPKKKTEEDPQ